MQVSKSVFSVEYLTFRELLRDLRLQKGVTQAQLSAALGMAQSFVSKYEMGERRLDFIEVERICGKLGIGLGEFETYPVDEFRTTRVWGGGIQIREESRRCEACYGVVPPNKATASSSTET